MPQTSCQRENASRIIHKCWRELYGSMCIWVSVGVFIKEKYHAQNTAEQGTRNTFQRQEIPYWYIFLDNSWLTVASFAIYKGKIKRNNG